MGPKCPSALLGLDSMDSSVLDVLAITVWTDYCSLGTHFTDSLSTISHLITYIFAHQWQTAWLLTLTSYTFVSRL